eukprot:Nitzschia sp. Nitz4//scaffold18_size181773//174112//177214//NITZ4_001947-RA/size181773-snap-gene-0.284-mRNA-1//-1//CDS//3329540107//6022//frame0
MESVSNTSTAILTSLPILDALRIQDADSSTVGATWIRDSGNNLDVMQGDSDTSVLAICHIDGLIPFSMGDKLPVQNKWEDAAGVALAAHHLNVGDGSIISEIQGLNETCNIRFTVEFSDTEYSRRVTLEHMMEVLNREPDSPTERLPCAYIGAYGSANTIPASILSGLRGYPQVSAQSTSTDLDDKSQFPLFARTVPPDSGNSIPIILFLNQVLHATHLAVLHINNSFGNSFVQGLRNAASEYAPEMEIFQVTIDPDQENWIVHALERIRDSGYRYTFALVTGQSTHDQLFLEAYKMGMAGNGEYAWFLGDSYSQLEGRVFEPDSLLPLAYQGTGQIQASGGIRDIGLDHFDEFMKVFEQLNNPEDLEYLHSLMPWHDPEQYPESVVDVNDFFLETRGQHTPFLYEATVALGLAACRTVGGATTVEDLQLSGQDHYDTMVNSVIHGVVNDLDFDPSTGSRRPSSTLYRVSNIIPGETANDGSVTYREVFSHVFVNGTWEEVVPFVFGDATNTIPSDTPPAETVDENLSTALQVSVLSLYGIVFLLVAYFMRWTYINRKTRVVLASQPIFLHIICLGLMVFASAMIPLALDHKVLSMEGCSRACTTVPWLLVLGFSMTVSALLTKTHRVNILLLNKTTKRLKRIKVSIMDVARPMVALVSINTILLIIMTALGAPYFEFVVEDYDNFDRPSHVRGRCNYSDAIPYLAVMCSLDFLAVLLAIAEGYQARDLSTEFSESTHIFKALVAISLVSFVAGPIMLLARDNTNAFVFALSALLFVGSTSILLLLFVPKMTYLAEYQKDHRSANDQQVNTSGRPSVSRSHHRRLHISGLECTQANMEYGRSESDLGNMDSSNHSREGTTIESGQALEAFMGMKVLSTKSRPELLRENEELRKLLRKSIKRGGISSSGISGENGRRGFGGYSSKQGSSFMDDDDDDDVVVQLAEESFVPFTPSNRDPDDSVASLVVGINHAGALQAAPAVPAQPANDQSKEEGDHNMYVDTIEPIHALEPSH